MDPAYIKKYGGGDQYGKGGVKKKPKEAVIKTVAEYILKSGPNAGKTTYIRIQPEGAVSGKSATFGSAKYFELRKQYLTENKPDNEPAENKPDNEPDNEPDNIPSDAEDIADDPYLLEAEKDLDDDKKESSIALLPKQPGIDFKLTKYNNKKDIPKRLYPSDLPEDQKKYIEKDLREGAGRARTDSITTLATIDENNTDRKEVSRLSKVAGFSVKNAAVNNAQSVKKIKRKAQMAMLLDKKYDPPTAPPTAPPKPAAVPQSTPLTAIRPSATFNPTPADNQTSGLKQGEDKKPDRSMYPVEVQKYFIGADFSALLNYVKSKNANKLKDKTVEYLRKLCQDLAQSLGVALKYNGTNKEFLLLQLYELITIQIGKKRTEQKQKNENPDTKVMAMVDFEQLLGKGSKLDMNKLDQQYSAGGKVKMMATGGQYNVNAGAFKDAFRNNPKQVASDVGSTQGRTLQTNPLYLDGMATQMRDIIPEEEGAVSNDNKNKYARKTFDLGDALFGVENDYSKRNAEKLQEPAQLFKNNLEFKYASKPKQGKKFIIDFA